MMLKMYFKEAVLFGQKSGASRPEKDRFLHLEAVLFLGKMVLCPEK